MGIWDIKLMLLLIFTCSGVPSFPYTIWGGTASVFKGSWNQQLQVLGLCRCMWGASHSLTTTAYPNLAHCPQSPGFCLSAVYMCSLAYQATEYWSGLANYCVAVLILLAGIPCFANISSFWAQCSISTNLVDCMNRPLVCMGGWSITTCVDLPFPHNKLVCEP